MGVCFECKRGLGVGGVTEAFNQLVLSISIRFGVSLWDMPLPHIPQKPYYITPARIGWQA